MGDALDLSPGVAPVPGDATRSGVSGKGNREMSGRSSQNQAVPGRSRFAALPSTGHHLDIGSLAGRQHRPETRVSRSRSLPPVVLFRPGDGCPIRCENRRRRAWFRLRDQRRLISPRLYLEKALAGRVADPVSQRSHRGGRYRRTTGVTCRMMSPQAANQGLSKIRNRRTPVKSRDFTVPTGTPANSAIS